MTIIWSLILVNVNSWVLGKQVEMSHLSIMNTKLEKTVTKNFRRITIDAHFNFNENRQIYLKVLIESLVHCQECPVFLAINRKKFYQTLSSVKNSVTVLLFGSLVLLGLTEKSTSTTSDVFTIVLKRSHLKLWRTFEQPRLINHSYNKYLAPNKFSNI